MRLVPSSVLAASAAALLLSGAASAQTSQAQTPQASPDAARPPLMTAPRPDDTPATPPAASPEGLGGDAPSDEMKRVAPSVAAIPHLLTPEEARTLIGKEVRTRDGQPGGSIKDFTLDGSAAAIERIVLAPAEGSGADGKLRSLPVSMLRTDIAGAAASADGSTPPTLDLPAAELARAPEFTYGEGVKTVTGQPQ
ncbi:PRC-barrel domain containing protein [Azospirillum sp. Vi22]|uniref:PRC-barrel domain-containing protein n=1 Tax=Azospirillum baldaniorum TaxID=1064539 RepID=UPI00119E977C|nr:PRC-barrel domain-containing protein [Azospirillum baldaniorum]NUB06246.1 PRC-barrel domain containing protein [Azospirillum baldaniorum]TWA66745.1 PRC-barrel domain protein [Azospirillum baldaniorum]